MISRGYMSGITGNPAECFPAGTMIMTERGEMDIAEVANMPCPPRVLSFNHEKHVMEWRPVIAAREVQSSEYTEITTTGGRRIRSTGNHPYYTTKRGYQQAVFLVRGDTLVSIGDIGVSTLRGEEGQRESCLSTMLSENEKDRCRGLLRNLWERCAQVARGVRKGYSEWNNCDVLLSKVHGDRICGSIWSKVSGMWRPYYAWARKKVLLNCVSRGRAHKQEARKDMCCLRPGVSAKVFENSLLQQGLCKSGALCADDRCGELPLQGWKKLRALVFKNARDHSGKRPELLCLLRRTGSQNRDCLEGHPSGKKQSCYTSCGRRPNQQPIRKPDNDVLEMSYYTSQIGNDTVSSVAVMGGACDIVYDIQVEGNSNFFAEGVLVHNCIIIDDPIKNKQEADSETDREKKWEEYLGSIRTRLHAQGYIILILTRWHEDDIAGRIIERESLPVEVIRLPCEAEEGDVLGRAVGDPLFPEIGKDKAWLEEFKAAYINDPSSGGLRSWNAMFQCRPSSLAGNIFQRDWWRFWVPEGWNPKENLVIIQMQDGTYRTVEPIVLPRDMDRELQSWDLTFKDGDGVDNVAGGCWGLRGASVFLLDTIYKPMSFVQTLSAIEAFSAKWPKALIKYIEEKANGSAVFSMLHQKLRGIVMVEPKGRKVERAAASSDLVYTGNVYLPHPKLYPWVNPYMDQLANFPNVPNDDYVDMTSQALLQVMYAKDAIPRADKNLLQQHKERKARELRGGRTRRINRR